MLLLVLQQMLHLRSVTLHTFFFIKGQLVVEQLLLQNMVTQLLGREVPAIALQGQQLVEAVDLQRHIQLVGVLAGHYLLHVEVTAHDKVYKFIVYFIRTRQLHFLISKHLLELIPGKVNLSLGSIRIILRCSTGIIQWDDVCKTLGSEEDVCYNLVGIVHLLLIIENSHRENKLYRSLASRLPFRTGRRIVLLQKRYPLG